MAKSFSSRKENAGNVVVKLSLDGKSRELDTETGYSPTAAEGLKIVEDAGAPNADVRYYLNKDLLLVAQTLREGQ
ncbi:UNVERIFIED_CONTAM: hypothetical protein HDU68_006026 [Siphonaria sp. JEL0065]|nr:hypothetical protein HDU68_006026 [Siphonaria sp. JEL0065]